MIKYIIKIYHRILKLFFDDEVEVYGIFQKPIKVNRIMSYKYFRIKPHNFLSSIPKIKKNKFKTKVKVNEYKIIKSTINTNNINLNFVDFLLMKNYKLKFLTICMEYFINLKKKFSEINNLILSFDTEIHSLSKRDIIISKRVTTEKEILGIEPYQFELPSEKIRGLAIEKSPLSKEIFSSRQLNLMREKLAVSAKCKKYSIKLENIYDSFSYSLYSKVELQKNNKVMYKLNENESEDKQMYFFITGKKRYDTDTQTALITYRELGIK